MRQSSPREGSVTEGDGQSYLHLRMVISAESHHEIMGCEACKDNSERVKDDVVAREASPELLDEG